jgi:hypothetical protein
VPQAAAADKQPEEPDMKTTVFVVALALLPALAGAKGPQDQAQYAISVRLFAVDPANPGAADVIASPQFRTLGSEVSMNLGDSVNNIRMAITPSDLGAGRVGLKVVVEMRRDGRSAASTFDVLSGAGAAPATIALRDAGGTFVLDAKGRPIFAVIEAQRK